MGHRPPSKEQEEALLDDYPHYLEYKACQNKAFYTASGTMLAAGTSFYLMMNTWYKSNKPKFSSNWVIAAPILAGTAVSFYVAMTTSRTCNRIWMANEERHSAITSAEERIKMRQEAESAET